MSTAPGAKTGRIKFVDPSKNYGYVLDDEQPNPRITYFFASSTVDKLEDLVQIRPGATVEYWLDSNGKTVRSMKLVKKSPGWSHEKAKEHTLVERLFERCATHSPAGVDCTRREELAKDDWCERCLAATRLVELGEPVGTPAKKGVNG